MDNFCWNCLESTDSPIDIVLELCDQRYLIGEEPIQLMTFITPKFQCLCPFCHSNGIVINVADDTNKWICDVVSSYINDNRQWLIGKENERKSI